jgi:hypothetical protein
MFYNYTRSFPNFLKILNQLQVGVFDQAVKLDSSCIFSIFNVFDCAVKVDSPCIFFQKISTFFLFSENVRTYFTIFLAERIWILRLLWVYNSASNEIFGIYQEFVT